MTLEQAIQENTKAVLALTCAFLAQPKAAAPASTGGVQSAPPASASPSATPAAAAPTTKLQYKDVANPVTAYVKAYGKDEAIKVLAPFKIARLTEAKEEQWPDILVAITTAAARKEEENAKNA